MKRDDFEPLSPQFDHEALFVWELFKCAVQDNGLPAALALLPLERRTLYRKHFKAHNQPWWQPDAIWAKWPGMLEELASKTALCT